MMYRIDNAITTFRDLTLCNVHADPAVLQLGGLLLVCSFANASSIHLMQT